jgi:invasion protein IalB
MSRSLLSVLSLALVGFLGAGSGIARQQPDATSRSTRKAALLPASPRFAAEPVATALAAQLPNGASSINEAYGNWAVACRICQRAEAVSACPRSKWQPNRGAALRHRASNVEQWDDGGHDADAVRVEARCWRHPDT